MNRLAMRTTIYFFNGIEQEDMAWTEKNVYPDLNHCQVYQLCFLNCLNIYYFFSWIYHSHHPLLLEEKYNVCFSKYIFFFLVDFYLGVHPYL